MRHSIALLLFAQNAKKDVFHKKNLWCSTVRQTTSVFQYLTKHTFQTAKAAQLPLFFSSDLSNEIDSSERQLTTSIKSILDKGFQSVICIGNDCPQLTVNVLQKATTQLQNGQSVIGPDMRGGVYLIGIRSEDFQADIFEKLPWKTAQLFESLGQILGAKTHLLPVLADINAEIDLYAWAQNNKTGKSFQKLLLSLLTVIVRTIVVSQPDFCFSFHETSDCLRPPPTLLL